jgi:thiol-disulfide isomerase/thioredoxin
MQVFKEAVKRMGFILTMALLFSSVAKAEVLEGVAPDFTLKSRSGENVKLSEHRGDVVMINFWASWCAPCRQEMPLLEDMYKKYGDLGFVLLGVNVEEDSSKASELLREIPVSFPILYDNKNEVTQLYKVVAMPSTVMVDRDGNMRYLHRGYLPGYEAEYVKQIKELVRE